MKTQKTSHSNFETNTLSEDAINEGIDVDNSGKKLIRPLSVKDRERQRDRDTQRHTKTHKDTQKKVSINLNKTVIKSSIKRMPKQTF